MLNTPALCLCAGVWVFCVKRISMSPQSISVEVQSAPQATPMRELWSLTGLFLQLCSTFHQSVSLVERLLLLTPRLYTSAILPFWTSFTNMNNLAESTEISEEKDISHHGVCFFPPEGRQPVYVFQHQQVAKRMSRCMLKFIFQVKMW